MNDPRPSRILVVDDTDLNRIVLSTILESNYTVVSAADGYQALALARTEPPPDLILLDIMMPGMDGFEVCRILREEPATRDIPVIFISALKGPEHTSQGFATGAVDYITKPFDNAEILARVKTHLALRNARESLKEQNLLLQRTIAKQHLGIGLAKHIMTLVNGTPPRHTPLPDGLNLYLEALTAPCNAEGGDHYLVRTVDPAPEHPHGKTVISLKDQSGHEVECILRSIITDLTHNSLLGKTPAAPVEETIGRLNNLIHDSGFFAADAFCTGITVELDHATRHLRYVSAGHPPFLLIRNHRVQSVPAPGAKGGNLPIAILGKQTYTADTMLLEPGDRLILYTDGLVEMPQRNAHRTMDRRELEELVAEIVAETPDMGVRDLVHALLATVARRSGEQVRPFAENSSDDDVTLLGMEIEDWRHCQEQTLRPQDTADLDRCIADLYETLEPELLERGFDAPEARIGMALNEAVVNAWKHGNRMRGDQTVTVRWHFGNDLVLEVIDQGDGFDPESLGDPTARENLTKSSGRGIFIIARLASFLDWRSGGRHLVATFARAPNRREEHRNQNPTKLIQLW